MSLQPLRRRLLGALALGLPAAAWSQAIGRVPTVTRLVQQFLDLEARLLAAQRGDDAALRALLADDFELRLARRPGQPVARAEWLATLAQHRPGEALIEQMAVHDHGSVASVSFLLRPTDAHAVPQFIVDTWAREGEAWRLKVRYAAPAIDAPR